MSAEEVSLKGLTDIDTTHEELLKCTDAFNTKLASKSEQVVCDIGEKEDAFKKEIHSMNEEICNSQQTLTDLTNRYMIERKECQKNEAKLNEISQQLHELEHEKCQILPSKLNEIEQSNALKSQELHQKKLKLKHLILKNEKKIKRLLFECKQFESYFAMKCAVVPNTENLKISFEQIDRYQPQQAYFVVLACVHQQYKVIAMEPNHGNVQPVMRYLEGRLNSNQIRLSQFVKLIRSYFVMIAQQQQQR